MATRKLLATLATRFEVDHHGDFYDENTLWTSDQGVVPVSVWNHGSWESRLVIGAAKLQQDAHGLKAHVEFFDTQEAVDTYETIKALAERGYSNEWSYGFDIISSQHGVRVGNGSMKANLLEILRVHEISPVLKGAGKSTRTDFPDSRQVVEPERELVTASKSADLELQLLHTRLLLLDDDVSFPMPSTPDAKAEARRARAFLAND